MLVLSKFCFTYNECDVESASYSLFYLLGQKNKKEVNIINSSNDNKNKNGVSLTLIFKIVRMVLFVTDYNCRWTFSPSVHRYMKSRLRNLQP